MTTSRRTPFVPSFLPSFLSPFFHEINAWIFQPIHLDYPTARLDRTFVGLIWVKRGIFRGFVVVSCLRLRRAIEKGRDRPAFAFPTHVGIRPARGNTET